MARNNDLVVTAGLNIEASVAQIEKDLNKNFFFGGQF